MFVNKLFGNWLCKQQWRERDRACRGNHLLPGIRWRGRWSGRRKHDHFFGAGPRTFLMPHLFFFNRKRKKINHNNGRKEVTLPMVWWDRSECMNWDHDPQLKWAEATVYLKLRDPSFYPEPQDHIWQSVNTDLCQSVKLVSIKPTAFESSSYNQLKAKPGTLHSAIGLCFMKNYLLLCLQMLKNIHPVDLITLACSSLLIQFRSQCSVPSFRSFLSTLPTFY